MDLIFKGGKVVTPSETFKADVGVKDGKIVAIASDLSGCLSVQSSSVGVAPKVVRIPGKYLLPGAIDSHVHLDLDVGIAVTADDYLSGTRAAACGGTTTVLDYPTQYGSQTILDAVEERDQMAGPVACVDYGFHCAITDMQDGKILDQFEEALDAGISSFKCYMVYKERGLMTDDAQLMAILKKAKETGIMVNVHCENEDVLVANQKRFIAEGKTTPWYHYASRPEYVSGEAVSRAVRLAKQLDAPIYIVHTDSADGVRTIQQAQAEGYKVYLETCPQYLEFTRDVYKRDDACKFVCSPPIKGQESQDTIWQALKNGMATTIATDHCSFNLADKEKGLDDFTKIPNGCAGIENCYPYMLSSATQGKLSYNRVVELCCSNPARIFGCVGKGSIAVGNDADLVVYDPEKEVEIKNEDLHGNSDYSIYEGCKMQGYPVQTYLRGKLVYDNGKFVGKPGWGKYIKRKKGELL